jgi:GNAT superfamily N-acetyltransferase
MITISEAVIDDIRIIQEIAYKTWPVAYGEILSKEQIDYMLEKMYSDTALSNNLKSLEHRFLLIKENEICQGFASYEHNYLNKNCTRLHKLYLLPESHGKGLGKLLLDKVEYLAQKNQSNTISLNVNRFNKAYIFYQKMGFEIIEEEDLAIGNSYLMEDYKMEKKL